MFINDYKVEEYNVIFDVMDGDHRMTVRGARIAQTKSQKQMIEIGFTVDGCAATYIDRLVEGEYFDRMATKFFDAFGITRGDFNFGHWVGKSGTGHFEHQLESYNDAQTGQLKQVNRCVMKYYVIGQPQTQSQDSLNPGYQPKPQGAPVTQAVNNDGFPEDIPF